MEWIIPAALAAAVVLVIVVVRTRELRRRRSPSGGGVPNPAVTPDAAAAASARLSEDAHRRIYSLIAQNGTIPAVQAFRKATGSSIREAAQAVAALAQFPQVYKGPELEAPETGHPEQAEARQPAQQPGAASPAGYRYRAIVSRGDTVLEIASTRLNDEVFGQVRTLALAGDLAGAARLLREHSDAGAEQAQEFVAMIGPED